MNRWVYVASSDRIMKGMKQLRHEIVRESSKHGKAYDYLTIFLTHAPCIRHRLESTHS